MGCAFIMFIIFLMTASLVFSGDEVPIQRVHKDGSQQVKATAIEQRLPVFEIAPGFGYAFGGGTEGSSPDLFLATFVATFWFSRRFGVGADYVRSIGQDLYDQAIISPTEPIGDTYPREYRGQEGLRYYRVMMRYRRPLSERMDMNFGAGLLLGGRSRDIVILHAPEGPVSLSPETQFDGFSVQLLFGRRLAPHLTLKSGVALDINVETNFLLPMVQIVIDF